MLPVWLYIHFVLLHVICTLSVNLYFTLDLFPNKLQNFNDQFYKITLPPIGIHNTDTNDTLFGWPSS